MESGLAMDQGTRNLHYVGWLYTHQATSSSSFLVDELGRPPRVFTLWVPDIPRRVKMHWQGNVIRRILGLERFKKLFKDLDKFLNILFKK